MDLKQEYRKQLADNLVWRRKQAQASMSDLPALPVEPTEVRSCYDNTPCFTLLYSRKLMEQIQAALIEQGYTLDYSHTEADVSSCWDDPLQQWSRHSENLPWPRPKFSVEFSDKLAGSVCQRKE